MCVIECKRDKGMENSMFGREVTSGEGKARSEDGAQKASAIFALLCLLI